MSSLQSLVADAAGHYATERVGAPRRLDAIIDAVVKRFESLPDAPTTKAWAAAKLAVTLPAVPALGAGLFGTLPLDTALCRRRAQRFPQALATGDPAVVGSLITLDPADRYLVTSDLHRCIPGRRDWPRLQATDELYRVALEHYGAADWALVEAGDVEDFWMVGGSSVGVAIDAFRLLGLLLWPFDRRVSHAATRSQLRCILKNYAATYAGIAERFARPGRYWRLSGNHDDVLGRAEVAAELARHLPGFQLQDVISLGVPGETPEAVITHGHLTDPWNSPLGAWRGRVVTWLAGAIADLTGREMGITGASAREALVSGQAGNRLRSIRGPFSMDRDQFTLNETDLHEAFAGHFGENTGPWLVLGHTHVPNDGPWDPGTDSRYERYVNSGSGVSERVITAVEWDGTQAERRPVLVAFARESDLEPSPSDTALTGPAHRIALQAGKRTTIGSLDGEPVIRVELRAPAS